MTINLRQGHIDHGVKGQCRSCPIALAITEATDIGDVYVNGINAVFYAYGPREFIAPLPASAAMFAVNFDCGLTVSPFSFELEVPA